MIELQIIPESSAHECVLANLLSFGVGDERTIALDYARSGGDFVSLYSGEGG